METLRRIVQRINMQMTDLTASQRLAIGLCAVVIFGSFMWLIRWSAEPDYVRLLEEPMTTEQLAVARKALPEGQFEIRGGHIFVQVSDRHKMFWQLQDAGALPVDTHITFEKLIEDDSPFRPESENTFRRRVALQNELAKVIAASPAIQSADVFLTDARDRRVNRPNTVPTASVTVRLTPGSVLDQGMATAFARIVSGAVPGLAIHKVSVIDGATMRPYVVPSPEDAVAQSLLLEEKKREDHLIQKLERQLSYIPGVRVAVSVELDAARRQTRAFAYAKPEVLEETTSNNETRSGPTSGEPGVGPNVGQSLSGGGDLETDTREQTSTKFQDQRLTQETTTQEFPFTQKRATATIGIPRSFIVGAIQAQTGQTTEPSSEEIDAHLRLMRKGIRDTVETIVMARSEEDVTVDMFVDVTPTVTFRADGTPVLATEMGSGGGGSVMDWVRRYGLEGGLALMALTGLILMVQVARKSAREAAHVYSQQSGPRRPPGQVGDVSVESAPVGSAEPTRGSALVGQEVDEETLRHEEMARQVTQYVNENAEGVAHLIQRWADASG